MTSHRAAMALIALAFLGPTVAIGMTLLVGNSFAGDTWAHGKLVELWVLCAAWPLVCFAGAYTQWRRR